MSASDPAGWMARACSESPVSALNVEMCMAQHLLLSALTRHRPTPRRCGADFQKSTLVRGQVHAELARRRFVETISVGDRVRLANRSAKRPHLTNTNHV
jgi:hypothetical protein